MSEHQKPQFDQDHLNELAADADLSTMSRGKFLKLAAGAGLGLLGLPEVAKAAAGSGDKKTPFDKEFIEVVTDALNEINHNTSPNIFYGAILLTKISDSKHPGGCIHMAPRNKYFDATISGLPYDSHVLVNPVVQEINGRLYAAAYERSDLTKWPTGIAARYKFSNYDLAAKTAATNDWHLLNRNRFIDLGEAWAINGPHRMLFFREYQAKQPVMAHQRIVDGQRVIKEHAYPPIAEVEGYWYGFEFPYDPPDHDKTDPIAYLDSQGFSEMGLGYKPPFYSAMLKASHQKA